ncbi:MAG: hypothetical protein ACTHMC_25990 [Pseudobacter sp.]|uniref:hypothetical protein n=1 Tax=Pseudobacter sp. TaxID=2045420 RepID=UPI003F7F9631
MIRTYKLFAFLCGISLFFFKAPVLAQTSGAGYVSSIEAKAKQILALEAEIEALKQKISRLGVQKQESINNAKRRLAEAIERTKNEASWKNRLQTAQDGWEEKSPGTCSAGGPPPICPANHWFKTTTAASMAKYNKYLNDYLKPFKDAVDDAGYDEQREIEKAGKDIDQKTLQLPDLRKQLVALSRQYEDHMKETAEKKAKTYGMELVRLLSEVHYQEDLVAQYGKLIEENNAKEAAKKKEVTDKVKAQIESLKKKLEQDIVLLESKCKQDIASREAAIQQHNTVIADLKNRVLDVEKKIQDHKGPETQKLAYEEQKNNLLKSQWAEETKVRELTTAIKQLKDQLYQETTMIRNESFKLSSNESSKIAEAVKLVEDAFTAQREILQKAKNNAEIRLSGMSKLYKLKTDEKNREYNKWVNVADGERVRVLRACQSVSCACYGTYVVNEANMTWNRTKDCLNSIDRIRRTNGSVVYTNCTELRAYYDSLYKGYEGGNSVSEQEAIEQQKARNRFENLIDN